MVALFFAMLFMIAPLLCIRFCQLKHASWRTAVAAAMAEAHVKFHGENAPQRPEAPPFDDAVRMLHSIVEFVPSTMLPAVSIVLYGAIRSGCKTEVDLRIAPPLRPPKHT